MTLDYDKPAKETKFISHIEDSVSTTAKDYIFEFLYDIISKISPDEPGVGCEDGECGILALDVIFHGAEYLLIQRHHVHHHLLLKFDWLRHTVFLLAESANTRRRTFCIQ
jgi:hypothetical protein